MATTTFDPVAYKVTTTAQWQAAAGAWHDWGPVIEAWLGESTDLMLDLVDIGPGDQVLDLAAGAGGQTFSAAHRVGPTGRVLATDVSENLLAYLERDAAAAGLTNVTTRVMDGEQVIIEAGHFDAVISRVGLIYFPDQHGALVGMRRTLRAGGRVGAIVYSTPDANRFFSVPVSIIRERAQLPAPAIGQPGPFSLGAPGVLADALTEAGFVDVEVHAVPAPLLFPTAAECVRFERESFGALHQMLSGLDDAEREAAWAEIVGRLQEFEGAEGFVGPCEMLVAVGTNPGDA